METVFCARAPSLDNGATVYTTEDLDALFTTGSQSIHCRFIKSLGIRRHEGGVLHRRRLKPTEPTLRPCTTLLPPLEAAHKGCGRLRTCGSADEAVQGGPQCKDPHARRALLKAAISPSNGSEVLTTCHLCCALPRAVRAQDLNVR